MSSCWKRVLILLPLLFVVASPIAKADIRITYGDKVTNLAIWLAKNTEVENPWRVAVLLSQTKYPKTLAGILKIEGNHRCNLVSRAGAVGPFQFMPATLRDYKVKDYDPHNWTENVKLAERVLVDKIKWRGSWAKGVEAYNGVGQTWYYNKVHGYVRSITV